ncbi:MAG TPA: type III pantothenate kinase [Gammaproteobacteria bacterium]|nr:type III pantothenate kinase [Gammaproteobacteria bacterium]
MKLLLDIGNSQLKWAALSGESLWPGGRLPHAGVDPRALLRDAWPWQGAPRAVVASNVAGARVAERIREGARVLWGLDPVFLAAAPEAYGLRCAYARPERLGADRWAAMLGAWHRVPGVHGHNVCVLDCGTAVTVDAITAQGQHLGGLIAPGPSLMREALHASTGDLAELWRTGEEPTGLEVLAGDTRGAIEAGVHACLAGLVERVVRELAREWNGDFLLVATGGDGALVRAWLPPGHRFVPELVLEGLAVVARELR